ncbi:MAG TPA: aldo/keto reductase [Polyangiaceae bacterium]|nr:aldo/keto reductase [Polyangiaceae bacterium]
MKSLTLPGTELTVSALAFGTGNWGTVSEQTLDTLYATFREAGGTTFDTAHCYAFWIQKLGVCEKELGRCLRRDKRSDVVVITKGGHPASLPDYPRPDAYLAPELVARDVDESLERLGVDSVDLWFAHRDDLRVPAGEIVDALNQEFRRGKLKHLGASNWTSARLREANDYAKAHGLAPFVASQPWWSLGKVTDLTKHDPTTPYFSPDDFVWHSQSQVAVFPWSSTANGYFAGKDKATWENPTSARRRERVRELASKRAATPNQVALAWLMHQPFPVVPLLGTTKLDHLKDALGAPGLDLSSDEVGWLSAE